MKILYRLILSFILIFAGINSADAKLRFGVKAGMNISDLHLNDPSVVLNTNNKDGWTAGIMTEFEVPVIGLCLDASAMYTRMNANVFQNKQVRYFGKDFIEVPINLKLKLGLPVIGKIFKPYVLTGPAFAFKLNNHDNADIETKGCQTAWNVGVGVELFSHLQLQGSYGFGINNVAKHWIEVTNDIKAKNNYWTITAAWLF